MSLTKKIILTVSALVLVVLLTIGGTFAYLTSQKSIKNVFTVGSVSVDLTETKGDTQEDGSKSFKLVPNSDVDKDPTITVKANSEDSYLFVELKKVCGATTHSFSDYVTYTAVSGWTKLTVDGGYDVYYQKYTSQNTDKTVKFFTNDKVHVVNFDDAAASDIKDKELSLTVYSGAIQDSADFTGANANAKALAAWKALAGNDCTLTK